MQSRQMLLKFSAITTKVKNRLPSFYVRNKKFYIINSHST
jgi:hypothetical protein